LPLFGNKKELHIELGDLQKEKEHLTVFLQQHLKVTIAESGEKLVVTGETLSLQELAQTVTKFVYHRDLNRSHYVFASGSNIKINRFEHDKKKKEKHDKGPAHQNMVQSWGL
jgi:hypothetical protein